MFSSGSYLVEQLTSPLVDPVLFDLDVPISEICYSLQEITWNHGKNVLAGKQSRDT
jgi:hypothetical protein